VNRSDEGFRQLERTMFRAWPSFDAVDYDGWVLRFSEGYTKRANSVNPHFGSSLPLAAKIAHCESAYRSRGLPTIFRLTPFSQPANLDTMLAELGYETLDPTLVMTCSLDGALGDEVDPEHIVSADQWFASFDNLRQLADSQSDPHRRIVESSEGGHCFVVISVDGEACACGLGVHVDDSIGLFDLFTHEAYREQGFGSSIVRSILGWARHRNARRGFLQVHSQNAPACQLYRHCGFEVAYPYWYRIKR
jgi:N-acetylglutamate synthase